MVITFDWFAFPAFHMKVSTENDVKKFFQHLHGSILISSNNTDGFFQ